MSDCFNEVTQKVIEILSRDISKIRFIHSNYSHCVDDDDYRDVDLSYVWTTTELPRLDKIWAVYPVDDNREILIKFHPRWTNRDTYISATLRTYTRRKSTFSSSKCTDATIFKYVSCDSDSEFYKLITPQWIDLITALRNEDDKRKELECQAALKALSL